MQTPIPQESTVAEKKPRNYAIFYASISIIICVFYIYTLYLTDPNLLFQGWEGLTWLFFLVQLVALGITMRKQQGGFIEFNQLIKPLFQSFFIAYIFKYIFVYTLITVMDPQLLELVRAFNIEFIIQQKQDNFTEEMIQQQIQRASTEEVSIFDFKGIVLHLVMGFILSLGISFILKLEKPEY